jgi:hypothetical protein
MAILDYLGILFLGLVVAAIAALILSHPWSALYLALGAIMTLVAGLGAIVYVALVYDTDDDGINANRPVSRPRR